ncbi:hypothetical protein SDC9_123121 [bioreactor metagenome]|uniref:Uncharacterized protein n=1 Tax=bioreactor metagenome TaxID=1076179 RepID=A0A645CGP2_9ZZZZ
MRVCFGDQVVHQIQARIAAADDFLGLAEQNLAEQFAAGGETRQLAVVARVDAIGNEVAVQYGSKHSVREGELCGFGLAAGQVEVEFVSAQGFVIRAGAFEFFGEGLLVHFRITHV